jgi:predicted dehydrogenase
MTRALARDNHNLAMPEGNTGGVRRGVLGVARIATEKIIPAVRRGQTNVVAAVASRSAGRARAVAARFAIPRAYGSLGDR